MQAAEGPEDQELVKKKVHVAEVDLNYSLYFPLDRPYSALYPNCKADSGKAVAPVEAHTAEMKGDRAIWGLVEKAMESGTLTDLRDSSTLKTNGYHPQTLSQDNTVKQERPLNKTKLIEGNSINGQKSESGNDFFEF